MQGEIVPTNTLWPSVYAVLSNHRKAGHTDEQTVNRLWTKCVTEPRPKIRESVDAVLAEDWPLDRLSLLVAPAEMTALTPYSESGPPIVVRWKGRDFRIDGRRRIISIVRRGAPGPYRVLVVDLQDRDFKL